MESAKELAEGKESVRILHEYTYKDLEQITDGFSAENFIGKTHLGELFRGKVHQGVETEDVIVKILTVNCERNHILESQLPRLKNEKKLLTDQKFSYHENLPELIGYCIEKEHLGMVYQLKAWDTLFNIVPQDGFKWTCRIKVALRFAHLLEFLDCQQIKVRNLDPRHIMVDQTFNPKLLEFGRIAGGVFGNMPPEFSVLEPMDYSDPYFVMTGNDLGSDVYACGVVLLALLSKSAVKDEMHFGAWAWHEYKRLEGKNKWHEFRRLKGKNRKKSFTHESLKADPFYNTGDGVVITNLAMRCVEENAKKRPTIHEIVSCLRGLNVVKQCPVLDIP